MKFPRNARMFKGQLDFTPFASVFFCLLIFILLSSLVYTPGVRIVLPETSAELPGAAGPTVSVALVASGQIFFENEIIKEPELSRRLKEKVKSSAEPLTLVVLADRDVKDGVLQDLYDLGRAAGINNILRARQPRPFDDVRARPQTP
jgi:biopolymer transport protein ExbD